MNVPICDLRALAIVVFESLHTLSQLHMTVTGYDTFIVVYLIVYLLFFVLSLYGLNKLWLMYIVSSPQTVHNNVIEWDSSGINIMNSSLLSLLVVCLDSLWSYYCEDILEWIHEMYDGSWYWESRNCKVTTTFLV